MASSLFSILSGAAPKDAGAAAGGLARHFSDRWALLLIGAAIVAVAWLVNRFAPAKKKRIRRTLILFAVYAGLEIVAAVVGATSDSHWGPRLAIAADLFEAFTTVNLLALVVFDLLLPAIRVNASFIVADLFVGAAYLVATFSQLRGAGVDPGSVVATSAIVSGVLALSLQATLGNILGGIALQLDHSITEGDWIQLPDGTQGKVRAIHWRHTVVETRNWDTLIVPNSNLLAANILILGKREGFPVQHRMWVYFNVDFRFSPARVIQVVQDALLATPIERVASSPPPNVICYDFAKDGRDSFGYYAVRYWLTDLATDDPTSSAVRERVYAALRRAKIPLARAAQTVFFAPDDSQNLEERAARHRVAQAKVLESVELFKPLTQEERTHLADHLVYAPFAKGEVITRQGAVAHWLYLLVAGRAEIRVKMDPPAPPKLITTLEAPAVFGEMGLMTGEPRSADVVAVTEAQCYRLDKAGFEQILHDRPEIADAMAKTMAKRRLELAAARDGRPSTMPGEEDHEAARILRGIRDFFGLAPTSRNPEAR